MCWVSVLHLLSVRLATTTALTHSPSNHYARHQPFAAARTLRPNSKLSVPANFDQVFRGATLVEDRVSASSSVFGTGINLGRMGTSLDVSGKGGGGGSSNSGSGSGAGGGSGSSNNYNSSSGGGGGGAWIAQCRPFGGARFISSINSTATLLVGRNRRRRLAATPAVPTTGWST